MSASAKRTSILVVFYRYTVKLFFSSVVLILSICPILEIFNILIKFLVLNKSLFLLNTITYNGLLKIIKFLVFKQVLIFVKYYNL